KPPENKQSKNILSIPRFRIKRRDIVIATLYYFFRLCFCDGRKTDFTYPWKNFLANAAYPQIKRIPCKT
ncbi:MAG: hypothetical protein M0R05_06565, partial [Bacilli bacterium]|nr:hypothetical protein [Bacilli bacterium]